MSKASSPGSVQATGRDHWLPLVPHSLADVLPCVASRGHARETDAAARTCKESWHEEMAWLPAVVNLAHGVHARSAVVVAAAE